jgi:hypothetical protein
LAAQAAIVFAYLSEREHRRNMEKALDRNRRVGAAVGI